MSTKITIEISLAADEQPTTREQAILNSMAAHPSSGTPAPAAVAAPVAAPKAAPVEAPVAAAVTVTTPKAAAGKLPAARPVGRPKAAPKAAEVPLALDVSLDEPVEEEVLEEEEAAAEVEEDLMGEGEEEAATAYTKEDAIASATKLVSNQKQAVVKAALVKAGAKRVSDLNDPADIQVFMAALEG